MKEIYLNKESYSVPTRNSEGVMVLKKGHFKIMKDEYLQFIIDLVKGKVMTRLFFLERLIRDYERKGNSTVLNAGFDKIYQLIVKDDNPPPLENGKSRLTFGEYCKKNEISITSKLGFWKFQNNRYVMLALVLYLRDVYDIKEPIEIQS